MEIVRTIESRTDCATKSYKFICILDHLKGVDDREAWPKVIAEYLRIHSYFWHKYDDHGGHVAVMVSDGKVVLDLSRWTGRRSAEDLEAIGVQAEDAYKELKAKVCEWVEMLAIFHRLDLIARAWEVSNLEKSVDKRNRELDKIEDKLGQLARKAHEHEPAPEKWDLRPRPRRDIPGLKEMRAWLRKGRKGERHGGERQRQEEASYD